MTPARTVHIGDRENDIYEFYCATQELGTHFIVRTCVDRLGGEGKHTVSTEMAELAVAAHHEFEIADGSSARLALKYKRVGVLPPIGKARRYPPLSLTLIHVTEIDPPEGRKPIDWKLLTDLPVEDPDQIFWLTMLNRGRPRESPGCVLTPGEIDVINRIAAHAGRPPGTSQTLSAYLVEIARLGGYLARRRDPPPGTMIMWRGWSRLMDIQLGATLANEPLVGN